MAAQLDAVDVLHARDDIVMATVRHQTPGHARRSGDTIRAVLRVLTLHSEEVRERTELWPHQNEHLIHVLRED